MRILLILLLLCTNAYAIQTIDCEEIVELVQQQGIECYLFKDLTCGYDYAPHYMPDGTFVFKADNNYTCSGKITCDDGSKYDLVCSYPGEG